ncbi:MAG: hypothetical protein ACWA44_02575 [Thiotrichales bacterium]
MKRAIKSAKRDEDGKWTQLRVAAALDIDKDIMSRQIRGLAHIDPLTIGAIARLLNVGIRFTVKGVPFAFNITEGIDTIIEPTEDVTDAQKADSKRRKQKDQ